MKKIHKFDSFLNESRQTELKELVFQALDNAIENEYDEVLTDDTEQVAMDLIGKDASIEEMEPSLADVEEYVVQWRKTKSKKESKNPFEPAKKGITMLFNLTDDNIKELEGFGARVKKVDLRDSKQEGFEVEFDTKETAKKILNWMDDKDGGQIQTEEYKELFPELFEGQEVVAADMKGEAESHIEEVKEALQAASAHLYEMKKMADYIKNEYPELAHKIYHTVEPMMTELETTYPEKLKSLLKKFK